MLSRIFRVPLLAALALLGVEAASARVANAQAATGSPEPAVAAISRPASRLTGKERLGDKASDEQRIDDCKVPPERRTRPRPDACSWVGS